MRRKFAFVLFFLILLSIGNAGDGIDSKVDDKVIEELQENENVNVIVVLKDEVEEGIGIFSTQEDVEVSDVVDDLNIDKEKEFSIINGFSGEISLQDLNKLLQDERVEKIEYDYPVYAFLDNSVPQINASLIHSLLIGSTNLTGSGETVCVIDTGVNYSHVDLGGCYGSNNENSSCKVLGGYDFVNADEDPLDDEGHGSHVAGIIASNDTFQRGVAPDVKLVVIKALDNTGTGTTSNVIAGIDWCVNNATIFGISVISMSLGSSLNATSYCDNDVGQTGFRDSINAAVAGNIFVSVAAGNDGNVTGISSPACIENATAVGSVGDNDIVSSFSNRANILDLLAPGENINATDYAGTYIEKSGTSMAAPHVSAATALLRQFFRLETGKTLTPNETLGNLTEYGITITDSGGSELNFSRIDLYNTTLRMDVYAPRVDITLTNDTLELNQQNLTISITYVDAFFDAKTSNASYPNGSLLADFIDTLDLITDNLTELGIYTINAWANDTNGNENLTTKTFLLQDTSGTPTFTSVNSPAGEPNFTGTSIVDFNVTIGSKYTLSNVTFYHNFTDWHLNETLSLNSNETNSEFNASFVEGVYLFGFGACDVNNICNFSENRTLIVDQSNPFVNLISPGNGSTTFATSAPSVTFNYNVSDYAISSCDLKINGEVNATDSSVNLNIDESISTTLNHGNYSWEISCLDNVGRSGVSENWNLTVCVAVWSCGSWSDSANSCGTRTCADSNSCGTDTGKPDTSKSCPSSGDTTSPGSTSPSGGGAATTTTTDKSVLNFQANAGDRKSFGISKDVGINGLELEFKNAVANAEVTVEKVDGQPAGVSAVDNVYKYLKINANFVDTDLKEAKIKFKVPKSWILINALNNPTNVFASRYSNGKWEKLETLTAGVEEEEQKYEAISPGFSYFSISADKKVAVAAAREEVVIEDNETEAEKIIEEEKVEKKENVFSRLFTGSVVKVKDLINAKGKLYIVIGVVALLIIGVLIYKFRSKFAFAGKIKKINLGKFSKFSKFRKIKDKIIGKEKAIKGKLKKRRKDKVAREKEKLEEEKKRLEEEKKEVEKLKREGEKIKEREEKEKRKKEKELEKQKGIEEEEKEEEERRRLKEEKEGLREEKRRIKKEKSEEKKIEREMKEKDVEEGFKIKHDEESKWEDFDLEDDD